MESMFCYLPGIFNMKQWQNIMAPTSVQYPMMSSLIVHFYIYIIVQLSQYLFSLSTLKIHMYFDIYSVILTIVSGLFHLGDVFWVYAY